MKSNQHNNSSTLLLLPTKLIALVGALLPGLGCYICIAYAYVFQFDRVRNFISSDCPNVTNSLPPVSYSIGVWEPQRFLWQFVMYAHFPARLFYPLLYKRLFCVIESERSKRKWFRILLFVLTRMLIIEIIALLFITVIDMRANFTIHAVAFGAWQLAFIVNVFVSAILQYTSGIRALSANLKYTFYAKIVIFIAGGILSLLTAITYAYYRVYCSKIAYLFFSLVEYLIIGCNAAFHLLLYWDCDNMKVELSTRNVDGSNRWEIKVHSQKLPTQVIFCS